MALSYQSDVVSRFKRDTLSRLHLCPSTSTVVATFALAHSIEMLRLLAVHTTSQTMHHRVLLFSVATLALFASFPSPSTAYKAKTTGQAGTAEPLVDAKIIEIEHTAEPKTVTTFESANLYPPSKHSEVVIEETHELSPESHIELSPHQLVVPYTPQSTYYSKSPYYQHTLPIQTSRPNTHFLLHVVPPGVRRKHESSIPDLLAILAPLAAIPLLGSLAVSSFTTMLSLTGLGRRRRRDLTEQHDHVLSQLTGLTNHNSNNSSSTSRSFSLLPLNHQVDSHTEADSLLLGNTSSQQFNPFETHLNQSGHSNGSSFAKELPLFDEVNESNDKKSSNPISELFQLDIVQQYLRQSGRPDHNDQIIASYLACRGMFSSGNHCLERLACHYADMENGRLRPLERDVAALIIYSLLRNTHIDSNFKRRLQRAALFGYDHTVSKTVPLGSSPYEASFIPVCDREFPCPKTDMP